jgi:hypothetical protein
VLEDKKLVKENNFKNSVASSKAPMPDVQSIPTKRKYEEVVYIID